jgi:hypothetical protein
MKPLANSLFSICLFLSLICLLKWRERRRRKALLFRQGLATALMGPNEPRA